MCNLLLLLLESKNCRTETSSQGVDTTFTTALFKFAFSVKAKINGLVFSDVNHSILI